MLILCRKVSESIVIGEGPNRIVVMVTDIDRNKVRLGIEAPREIPVHKEETWRKIVQQQGKTDDVG